MRLNDTSGGVGSGGRCVLALTATEQTVLRAFTRCDTNEEIGSLLGISSSTVRVHVRNIFGKLAVRSRSVAVARALRLGLLTWDDIPSLPREEEIYPR